MVYHLHVSKKIALKKNLPSSLLNIMQVLERDFQCGSKGGQKHATDSVKDYILFSGAGQTCLMGF